MAVRCTGWAHTWAWSFRATQSGWACSIGLFLWVVLVALALVGGAVESLFSLKLIGAHVRLLVVIPLMLVSETVLSPRMAAFARSLVRRGTVPENQVALLDSIVARVCRWRDSWFLEAICLLFCIVDVFWGRVGGQFRKYGNYLT